MTRKDLFMKSYGWVGAILLSLGIGLSVASVIVSAVTERFAFEGVRTEAEVVSTSERVTGRLGVDRSTIYEVTVRFAVKDETIEVTQQVPSWFYDYARPIGLDDGTIPVTYVEGDPGTVEIVRGRSGRITFWLRVGALVGLVAGGYWVWSAWRRASAVIGLRDKGERHLLRVKRLHDTKYNHDGVRQFRLIWDDPSGGEGCSYLIAQERAERYPPGTEIEVLVDRSGRLSSVWVEDLESS